MYLITDSYGTSQTCWRYATALSWLRVCSPDAAVFNRMTGKMIARRSQA